MPASLLDFYPGWEKHNQLLVTAIAPLTPDQLWFASAESMWSVRRLANHIIANRSWWFHAWMGEGGDDLGRFVDYDDVADADTHDAGLIVRGLESTWSRLAESLAGWTEKDLTATFKRPTPNAAGERPSRNRAFIIWHVAEHDVHHGGEISLILGSHGLTGLDM